MQEFVFCIQWVGVKVVNDVWRAVFLCREGVEVFPALNEFCRGDCTRCCGLWNRVLRGEGNVFSYLLHFCAFQWLGWVLLGLDSDTMALGRVSKLTVFGKEGDWLLVSFGSSVISSHKSTKSEEWGWQLLVHSWIILLSNTIRKKCLKCKKKTSKKMKLFILYLQRFKWKMLNLNHYSSMIYVNC